MIPCMFYLRVPTSSKIDGGFDPSKNRKSFAEKSDPVTQEKEADQEQEHTFLGVHTPKIIYIYIHTHVCNNITLMIMAILHSEKQGGSTTVPFTSNGHQLSSRGAKIARAALLELTQAHFGRRLRFERPHIATEP